MQHLHLKNPFFNTHFAFISPTHRLFSTSLRLAEITPIKSTFAVEYLVKSCGVPMEKALKASKYIPHLKSHDKPDSVLQFLREIGLDDDDIRKAVTSQPGILCASLETIIKPRVMEIQELGFSPSQVARLVPLAPGIFRSKCSSLLRALEFWTPFFGSLEGILVALKTAPFLLTVDVEKVIEPNILFLEKHCEISSDKIRKMIFRDPSLVTINPDKLKKAAQRAEKLGSARGSGLFIYALQITCRHSASNLDAKIKNLKNLGFSKKQISFMIKKQSMLLSKSDERIRSSVIFLTSEAGLDLPFIAHRPILLSFSLEKRIIPRQYVMKSLKSKGLCENWSFFSVMNISEKRFQDILVGPYKDIIPEVYEAYEAARAGKISLKDKL